jgi:hypothetical protein
LAKISLNLNGLWAEIVIRVWLGLYRLLEEKGCCEGFGVILKGIVQLLPGAGNPSLFNKSIPISSTYLCHTPDPTLSSLWQSTPISNLNLDQLDC